MLTLSDLQTILQISVFAVVVSDILTRPKMILERYGRWLDRLETTRPKLAYPLGYCAKCLAGQIALWLFPIVRCEVLAFSPVEGALRWVSFVALTILFSALLSQAVAILKH